MDEPRGERGRRPSRRRRRTGPRPASCCARASERMIGGVCGGHRALLQRRPDGRAHRRRGARVRWAAPACCSTSPRCCSCRRSRRCRDPGLGEAGGQSVVVVGVIVLLAHRLALSTRRRLPRCRGPRCPSRSWLSRRSRMVARLRERARREPRDIARRAALGVGVLVLCGDPGPRRRQCAAAVGRRRGGGHAGDRRRRDARRRRVLPARALAHPPRGARWACPPARCRRAGHRVRRRGRRARLPPRHSGPTCATNTSSASASWTWTCATRELPPGDTPLKLDVGIGEARLTVPDGRVRGTRGRRRAWAGGRVRRDNGGVDVQLEDHRDAPPRTAGWSWTRTSGWAHSWCATPATSVQLRPPRRFGRDSTRTARHLVGNVGCRSDAVRLGQTSPRSWRESR